MTLITTYYLTQHLPARESVVLLQMYFADNATEAIRNIEGTDVIVLTGFAADIASTLHMLTEIDARAKEEPNPRALEQMEARLRKLEAAVAALQKPAEKAAGK